MTLDNRKQLGADLSAYLDGELSQARAAEIEQLLAESPEARSMLEELRAISDQLGALPRTRAPRDLSRLEFLNAQRANAADQRSRIKRARVYRLVTRISASAAVIALCVFAGWNYFGRDARPHGGATHERLSGKPIDMGERFAVGGAPNSLSPAARGGELEGTAAKSSTAGAPAVAMRAPKSLGNVGGDSETNAPAETEVTPASPASKLAFADRVNADEHGATVIAAAPSPTPPNITDQPEINVIVAPRNASEYNGALLAVAQWRTPDGEAPKEGADASRMGVWSMPKSERGGGRFAPADAMMAQEITIHVPPDQVNSVLVALNEQAPRQVQATMSFNTGDISVVQQMVTPATATGRRISGAPESGGVDVTAAEETPQSDAALALGRETEAEENAAPGYAGRGGVRRGVATRAPATRDRAASGGEPTLDSEVDRDDSLEKRSSRARDKYSAMKTVPDSDALAAKKEPLGGVVQLGVRLRETYEQVFAAVFRGEGDQRLAESPQIIGQSLGEQPVRLRVQLLAPMDSQSTPQPAKASESP